MADYAGWSDLAFRYDLRRDIAYAKELAAQAEHLLYLDPVTPESSAEGHAVLESLMNHETLSQWDRQPETDKVSKRGYSMAEPQSHQPLGGKSQQEPVLEPASEPEHLTTEPQVLTPESTGTPRSQESGSNAGEMMTVELKVEGGSGSTTASVKIALPPSLFAHRAINPPPAPM